MTVPQLVVVNVLAWLLIHLGVAWAGTRLPIRLFSPRQWLYRARGWERGGRVYERHLGVKRWKDWLPDGAALFAGGFRKAGLEAASLEHLQRFERETCRGEAVHWAVLATSGFFFLWNPWGAGLLMIVYAVAANLPCILIQRYNRLRLARAIATRSGKGNTGGGNRAMRRTP
jgi:glycosyl-4,4'-diaponeurosporenoate acyltransferase